MGLSIRRGAPRDAATIAEFNRLMAWETEHKRLDAALTERGVARVFDDPAKGFYLVAERNGQVIGQLMVTYEWSDWRDGWFWWVQSVYVHAEQRRGGVFRTLYSAVVNEAKTSGNVVGIRLYVERDNSRAQTTYRQLGMTDAGYNVMEIVF